MLYIRFYECLIDLSGCAKALISMLKAAGYVSVASKVHSAVHIWALYVKTPSSGEKKLIMEEILNVFCK